MRFDRSKFFDEYRQQFRSLNQTQVDGLERLLWGVETYNGWWDNIDQIANAFAQIKSETAHSFHPCVEAFYLGDPKAPNYYTGNTDRVSRVQQGFRYYPHFGRGDIQLTWLENYRDQTGYVRKYFPELVTEFEHRTGQSFDLVKHPEQALDGKISFAIMTIGMHLGKFRAGHTLDRYINANEIDHFNARDIVNGDKNYKNQQGQKIGNVIAANALRFAKILRASLIDATELDILEVPASNRENEQAAELPAVIQPENEPANEAASLAAASDPASEAQPPTKEDGRQETGDREFGKFDAFVPQIDTAKGWLKRGIATVLGANVAARFAGLPEWMQMGLFGLLVLIIIGAIVMFIMYHKEIFAYVTKMNTLRATEDTGSPVIVGKPPK